VNLTWQAVTEVNLTGQASVKPARNASQREAGGSLSLRPALQPSGVRRAGTLRCLSAPMKFPYGAANAAFHPDGITTK